MWQYASRNGAGNHEPRNKLRVDPICLGACAQAGGEGFDLRGWQLPGRDPGGVEGRPQSPFLPAATRENDPLDRLLILAALEANKRVR